MRGAGPHIPPASGRRPAIDNGAGAVLVAAQLPAFGQGRQSGMLAVFAFQAFTAPQVVLERGRELERHCGRGGKTQRSRADDARLVAQRGGVHTCDKALVTAEAMGFHVFVHRVRQGFAFAGDTAAQQQHFRPKDIHHVHNGLAEIFLVLRHDGLCGIVARSHGVVYGFCGDAFFVQQAFGMRGRSL